MTGESREESRDSVSPETTRALVLQEWIAALGQHAEICADTDFFDAGGDSFAAAQIAFGLADTLGLDADREAALVEAMFEGQTPAQLAAGVLSRGRDG